MRDWLATIPVQIAEPQKMPHAKLGLPTVLVWCLLVQGQVLQQGQILRAQETISSEPEKLVGRLGNQPIRQGEIDFVLGRTLTLGEEKLSKLPFPVQQSTLHLLAQQLQALQTLRELKQAASLTEVRRWLLSTTPKDRPQPNADSILEGIGQTYGVEPDRLLEHMAFRLSWKTYLTKHLTEENVKKHFANQRARFDGTKFEVCFATSIVPAGASSQRENAVQVLEEFALSSQGLEDDAWFARAKEWMQAKSDEELGRQAGRKQVRGTGDVDPRLITPLLALEPGEWSEPIHTATGVHVLKLIQTLPGEAKLEEVKGDVRMHMLVFLLEHLASQSRDKLPLQAP